MTKLFNNIRKELVADKPSTARTTNYLKYAIGEIILVMIGILLALQVNTWNQNRVASHKEKVLLKELHQEFINNKIQLDTVLKYHNIALKSVNAVIAEFPINLKTINLDSLSKKFDGFGYRYTFNPSQGVIKSLVNTSTFEIISNDTLRRLLISWNDVLADYQEEEIIAANNLIDHIMPYFNRHSSSGGNFKDKRLDLKFLTTIEFENQFYDRQNNLENIIGNGSKGALRNVIELTTIKKTINKIIALSKTE
jgi:uncharacterized protein DUF6090